MAAQWLARIRRRADLVFLLLLVLSLALLPNGLPIGVAGLGVVSGSAIAAQALGLVLLYRATRIINFSQVVYGSVAAVLFFQFVKHLQFLVVLHAVCGGCVPGVPSGAAGAYWNLQNHPEVIARGLVAQHATWMAAANFWLSALIAFLIGARSSVSLQKWTAKYWRKAPRLVPTVASLGFATALAVWAASISNLREGRFSWDCFGACRIQLDPLIGWWPYDDAKGVQGVFQTPYKDASITLPFDSSGAHFHTADIMFVVLAFGAAAALMAVLKFTRLGVVLRGVADNQERAETLGIDVNRNLRWVWWIGGALSCAVAMIQVTTSLPNVANTLNVDTLTRVLAVAIFARMASIPLVLTAAIGLGIIDEGLFWNFHSHAPFFLVQLAIIAVALMLQTRRRTRAELESSTAWLASPEIRPTPRQLRRLPLVHGWTTYFPIVAALTLFGLPFFLDAGQVTTATIVLIYTVIGLSIFVLTGWAGQISLGQIGFAAIGGFVSVMLYQNLSFPLPLAIVLGGLAGAAAAAMVGFPGLRLPGPSLAVLTLAVAIAVNELLVSTRAPSLGVNLPVSINRPLLLGLDLNDEHVFYFLVLAVLTAAVVVVVGLRRSRMRRALIAARDNEPAAQSFGINIVMARLQAFAVSGFLAALAGALLAFEERGVKVVGFDPAIGTQLFLVVVIGGVGSLAGPLIGSIYYGGMSLLGEGMATLAVGGGVIGLLIWAPAGLAGAVFRGRDAILRRMAIRNRIPVPSLLADFTRTASGVLRAHIVPAPRRDGAEMFDGTRFELRGDGPGPVAGTRLSPDGSAAAPSAEQPGDAEEAWKEDIISRSLLSCRDLCVHYDAVQALFNVDLEVRRGEILALIGTNGAGKTTLLRAIAGLHPASKGAVWYDGTDITRMDAHKVARSGVALVPGGAGVFPSLTVAEHLRAASWQQGKAAGTAEVERVLEDFPRLRERLDTEAGNLSGGEQQMLALAQAFLVKPRLLLMDELSLGLSPQAVRTILDTLQRLKREGTAIVIVEQSLTLSVSVADRAVVLEKGAVRYTGTAHELLEHPELFQSISFGLAGGGVGGGSEVRRRLKQLGDTEQCVLEIDGVTASYGGVTAVRDVGIAVNAGEIVGIIGPNGAGKTTLFDVISGFHPPDAGTVTILGSDATRMEPYQRANLGLMRSFQNVRLFPSLTARDNIATALERHIQWKQPLFQGLWLPMSRAAERKAQARVDMLIELLGLEAQAERTLAEISIGTRRIVDIACQLAAGPRVLLLDEPSSGLPQIETEQLGPIIARIAKDLDAGILVIEHDVPLVSAVSDRLVAMDLGAVIADGPSQAVLADARVRESYFGGAATSAGSVPSREIAVTV